MSRCPECHSPVPVQRLLGAAAQGANFSRGAMRFCTRCSNCGAVVGLEPGSVRLFLLAWLCPLLPCAWLTEMAPVWLGLSLAASWFLLFPLLWLRRASLKSHELRRDA